MKIDSTVSQILTEFNEYKRPGAVDRVKALTPHEQKMIASYLLGNIMDICEDYTNITAPVQVTTIARMGFISALCLAALLTGNFRRTMYNGTVEIFFDPRFTGHNDLFRNTAFNALVREYACDHIETDNFPERVNVFWSGISNWCHFAHRDQADYIRDSCRYMLHFIHSDKNFKIFIRERKTTDGKTPKKYTSKLVQAC